MKDTLEAVYLLANKNFIWSTATLLLVLWGLYRYKNIIALYIKSQQFSDLTFRCFDIAISLSALIILSPILLFTCIVLKWHFGQNIFFKQERIGKDNKPFILLKFRSMTDATDNEGKLLKDSERLTKIGHLVRSSSIDELPGIVNVLRGDMSIIGPRPLVRQDLEEHAEEKDLVRHKIKPGITGWAQVNGRNHISWKEKFYHDAWYVENRSLKLNVMIVFLTAWKVFRREGIYKPGQSIVRDR